MGKKFKTYQEALDAVKNLGEDLKNSDMEFILIFTDRFNGSPFLHAGLYETITMVRALLLRLSKFSRKSILSVLETLNDATEDERMGFIKVYNKMIEESIKNRQ
jgi:hypothetical protein